MKAPNAVTDFLARHIDACGKTHKQIANEVGLDAVNMVSMMKSGDSKVPVERIRLLARAIGADEAEMTRIVLQIYYPELWMAIEEFAAHNRFEYAAMQVVRKHGRFVRDSPRPAR